MNPFVRTLVQAALILTASLVVAAVGNQVVERKLQLNRDYFPARHKGQPAETTPAGGEPKASNPDGTAANPAAGSPTENDPAGQPDAGTDPDAVAGTPENPAAGEKPSRAVPGPGGVLMINGIQVVELEDLTSYVELGEELCVLLDARKKDLYVQGHLPGAYYLDYYQHPDLFDTARDAVDTADFVVVYCNGGDCEDSLSLAHDLIYEYNVPEYKVWVYEGGYDEWTEHGHDVVKGEERR
ncbi:MAG: rhodanese-like domain-containing protein [Planctomycetota bacterium]